MRRHGWVGIAALAVLACIGWAYDSYWTAGIVSVGAVALIFVPILLDQAERREREQRAIREQLARIEAAITAIHNKQS